MAKRVRYPGGSGIPAMVVELPDVDEAIAAVPELLSIIASGYRVQFEEGTAPLVARRTVYNRYSPRIPANVARYVARTREHCQYGAAQLAIVHTDYRARDYRAYSKIGPAERCTDGLFTTGYYLYDVVARVHRQGAGSVALHAILKHSGLSPDESLALEAFTNSSVNGWYESLGLEHRADLSTDPFDFEDGVHTLPQTWYATPRTAGIGDIVTALETKGPWLAAAEPIVS